MIGPPGAFSLGCGCVIHHGCAQQWFYDRCQQTWWMDACRRLSCFTPLDPARHLWVCVKAGMPAPWKRGEKRKHLGDGGTVKVAMPNGKVAVTLWGASTIIIRWCDSVGWPESAILCPWQHASSRGVMVEP